MTDDKAAYDKSHEGHEHDTFAITSADMQDAAKLQTLLDRAAQRTQSSAARTDRGAAALGAAWGTHDQVATRAAQLEYDTARTVFEGWVQHQDRLLRQLAHLETRSSADALKRATWALVFVTGALLVATLVAAFIAQS